MFVSLWMYGRCCYTPARGIIRACSDSVSTWVELDGVDVRFMALEVLNVVARPHVPHERHLVTGLKNKGISKIILSVFKPDQLSWLLTPETNVFGFGPGARSTLMTSALCP